MKRQLLAALLLVLASLTACSAGSSRGTAAPAATPRTSSPSPTTAGPTTATPSPSASTPCDASGLKAAIVTDASGRRLEAATVGAGSTTVVLVHESGSAGMCGFADFAAWLAQAHSVRAVLFQQCGYGGSTCRDYSESGAHWVGATRAVVAWARSHGARRVVVVGASFGGTVALAVGSGVPKVDAVGDLSGERSINGLDAVRLARSVHVPLVLGVAPGDSYVSVDEMRQVAAAATGTHPQLVVSDLTGAHGWELLQESATTWAPVAQAVAALG